MATAHSPALFAVHVGRARERGIVSAIDARLATMRFVHVDAEVIVEIAETSEARVRGLGGHPPLGDNEGMLFIFDWPSRYAFWMRGMLFPLDMIWLDDHPSGDGTLVVVDITADVPLAPPSATDATRPTYSPARPARYVLEVNAGYALERGIVVDEIVTMTAEPIGS